MTTPTITKIITIYVIFEGAAAVFKDSWLFRVFLFVNNVYFSNWKIHFECWTFFEILITDKTILLEIVRLESLWWVLVSNERLSWLLYGGNEKLQAYNARVNRSRPAMDETTRNLRFFWKLTVLYKRLQAVRADSWVRSSPCFDLESCPGLYGVLWCLHFSKDNERRADGKGAKGRIVSTIVVHFYTVLYW